MANIKSRLCKWYQRIIHAKKSNQIWPEYVSIGRHTYGITRNMVAGLSSKSPLTIGAFCSFGPDVLILSQADHPIDLVSTYPFRSKILYQAKPNCDAITKGPIKIGHDVWIGARATLLSGITIGNGAVIGANCVVSKNIPAYAVVVGNPLRIIKYRFEEDIIEQLQAIAWWEFDDTQIKTLEPYFYGPVTAFIKMASQLRDQPTKV